MEFTLRSAPGFRNAIRRAKFRVELARIGRENKGIVRRYQKQKAQRRRRK